MRRGGQRQFGQALEQGLKGNQHFEPCQRRADAEMDSGAETYMRIWCARRIEHVGQRHAAELADDLPRDLHAGEQDLDAQTQEQADQELADPVPTQWRSHGIGSASDEVPRFGQNEQCRPR